MVRLKIIQEDHETYLTTESGERIENVRVHDVALPSYPHHTAPLATASIIEAELESRLTGSIYEVRTVNVGQAAKGTAAFLSEPL